MSARVLIVSTQHEGAQHLVQALAAAGFEVAGVALETDDLSLTVRKLKPDAILIDVDSPSRDTLEGLAVVSRSFPRPILMLSESADTDLVRNAARLGISAYAVEGISPPLLRSLVQVTIQNFQQQHELQTELREAQQALQDRRVIDKAKYKLVREMGMSEDDAYHQLRRMAMERSMKLAELARMLLERSAG